MDVSGFDRNAAAYATSASHAGGRTLQRLLETLPAAPGARLLDVATGAGHSALAFAARGARAVALDPSRGMLAAARGLAEERGLALPLVQAAAEALPFPGATFDAVVCRTAAHHFADVRAALCEMARVVRPGGRVAVTDLQGHADPGLDDLVDRIERLHDPTHVRSYTRERWRALFAAAGLAPETDEGDYPELPEGTSLFEWCARNCTPAEDVAEIRRLLLDAPAVLHVMVEGDDVRFWIHKCLLVGVRPGR